MSPHVECAVLLFTVITRPTEESQGLLGSVHLLLTLSPPHNPMRQEQTPAYCLCSSSPPALSSLRESLSLSIHHCIFCPVTNSQHHWAAKWPSGYYHCYWRLWPNKHKDTPSSFASVSGLGENILDMVCSKIKQAFRAPCWLESRPLWNKFEAGQDWGNYRNALSAQTGTYSRKEHLRTK